MKACYSIGLFLTISFVSGLNLSSQTITDKLGGINTNFILTSDTIPLNDQEQILIERAAAGYYIGSESGYGYGYQSIHLEFSSPYHISIQKETGRKRKYYALTFYDEDGQLLLRTEISEGKINRFSNNMGAFYVYSVNLKDVPLIILNKTQRINIMKHDAAWKY